MSDTSERASTPALNDDPAWLPNDGRSIVPILILHNVLYVGLCFVGMYAMNRFGPAMLASLQAHNWLVMTACLSSSILFTHRNGRPNWVLFPIHMLAYGAIMSMTIYFAVQAINAHPKVEDSIPSACALLAWAMGLAFFGQWLATRACVSVASRRNRA